MLCEHREDDAPLPLHIILDVKALWLACEGSKSFEGPPSQGRLNLYVFSRAMWLVWDLRIYYRLLRLPLDPAEGVRRYV